MHHVASLYQVGFDDAQHPDNWLSNQQTLDQVVAMLYARTGLILEDPYSRHLMVRELPDVGDALANDPATSDAASATEPAMITHDTHNTSLESDANLPAPAQQVPA
jgi:hypothetical protein